MCAYIDDRASIINSGLPVRGKNMFDANPAKPASQFEWAHRLLFGVGGFPTNDSARRALDRSSKRSLRDEPHLNTNNGVREALPDAPVWRVDCSRSCVWLVAARRIVDAQFFIIVRNYNFNISNKNQNPGLEYHQCNLNDQHIALNTKWPRSPNTK